MRLRVCLLCATCLISAGSLGAQDVERVGVAFSLPGGSSYAAYQGGVVTAVLSFMRASNAGGLDALYRAEGRVPRRYDLEAAVGSSAGGANALLAAIGWCMEEIPAPARSPHWEAWVPVGLSQLAPGADEASGGAFSRRFLREVYADTMRNAVDRATACSDEVRIGFALTRQDPDTLSIMGAIAVPTQKVATALKLSPRGAISPLDISGYPEVGKTILLADSGVSAAMRAIYATSAFPAAFAPVALQYAGDAGAAPVEDWFYDGGVFDDNPLWLLRSMIEARPPDGDRVHVVYVDPSRRAAATEGSDTDSVYFGVDQIRHMVRTAVPTARRSELSALARLPSGAVEMVPSLTTRYPAVFGSTLSNFGAFLSRSFREYDFLAGYYDGLRFAAQALACPPGAVFSCDDEPMDSSHRLVSELPLEDPALQSAFVALADCMASTPPDPVERCGDSGVGETDIRSRLLHAYVDVAPEIDAAHRADAVECTGASSMMCRSGLPEVFRALRSTEGLIGAIRQEAEPCVWDPNVSDWESDACPNRGFVERDLLDWIESPGLTFVRTADALIIRLMAASGRAADCGSSCASEVEGTSASSLLGAFWWYHRQSAPEAASSTNMG
ncbi:MAG: hypothetical protein HKN71_09530, partial [Gemmatimonadetes bacterium]|nr:hypothetical protein [Gemmatimonadota bacterium]